MNQAVALLAMIAQAASASHQAEFDCTAYMNRFYANSDLHSALSDINQIRALEYVFQNRKHFYYTDLDQKAASSLGIALQANERIVITFETSQSDMESIIRNYSCKTFYDYP